MAKTAKTAFRTFPLVLEINPFFWLHELSRKYRRRISLDTVPDTEWQEFRRRGFDAIWLMGVWQRSPTARQCALEDSDLRLAYDRALPGWTAEDVIGSGYAVFAYSPDRSFGSVDSLATVRGQLQRAGLKLILDFVPNHFALDHPWTEEQPDCFIWVSPEVARRHPGLFFRTGRGDWLAHGKDPYFPPWKDTVQVNFFSPLLRQRLAGQLLDIAAMCDGVRCDMAMLALSDIFEQGWGRYLPSRTEEEFWPPLIQAVKHRYPDFTFIAEVYWDREWQLQEMGFDFTYDKRLYDRLSHESAASVISHAQAALAYQSRSVHFIENHDERRSIAVFGAEKSCAAAAVAATLPGMRLFYQGQTQGATVQTPLQLCRRRNERPHSGIVRFYRKLLEFCDEAPLHQGVWFGPSACIAPPGQSGAEQVIAYRWQHGSVHRLVAINYGERPAGAIIYLPSEIKGVLRDALTGETVPVTVHSGHPTVTLQMAAWNVKLLRTR